MSENKEDIIQNLSKEDIKKKTMKYGNDDLYESPIDTHIFHPLGLLLVDPLRYRVELNFVIKFWKLGFYS